MYNNKEHSMFILRLFWFWIFFCGFLHAQQKQVTILVHGTGTGYKSKVLKFACYCPRGLHKMSDANEHQMGNYYTSKYTILSQSNSDIFDKDHIYNFGWSGHLGFTLRDQEGALLAQAVEDLVQKYKVEDGQYPYVRIVTFSHGGNVALNMGKYFKTIDHELHIDLIMIAPPVQAATKQLIYSPCFAHVYNIFSDADVIQRIDPQSLYAPVKESNQIFSDRYFVDVPCNCKQARITVKDKPVGHLELVHGLFSYMPTILQTLQNYQDTTICDINIPDQSYVSLKWYNFFKWYYAHCE